MRAVERSFSEVAADIAVVIPRPLRCNAESLRPEIERMLSLWKNALPSPEVSPTMAKERAKKCYKLVQRLRRELKLLPVPLVALGVTHEHLAALASMLERAAGKGGFKKPSSVGTYAVQCATAIIKSLSKKAPIGTPDGPLYLISPLVYEAFTGAPKRNLKHVIDAEMKQYR